MYVHVGARHLLRLATYMYTPACASKLHAWYVNIRPGVDRDSELGAYIQQFTLSPVLPSYPAPICHSLIQNAHALDFYDSLHGPTSGAARWPGILNSLQIRVSCFNLTVVVSRYI